MTGEAVLQLRRRAAVLRQALIMTPLALICVAGAFYAAVKVIGGEGGFIVMLSVTGLFSIVFGYLALQFLRDLNATPVTTEGTIVKKWTKGSMFFLLWPNFYISCKGKVFSTTRLDHVGLLEDDLVRVFHYPHSLTVESIERFDTGAKRWVPAFSEQAEIDRLVAEAERQRKG